MHVVIKTREDLDPTGKGAYWRIAPTSLELLETTIAKKKQMRYTTFGDSYADV